MASKYGRPGNITIKSWSFGASTNIKSSSVKMSDFVQHLKRQMVEGNTITRGNVTLSVTSRTPNDQEDGKSEVKAICEVTTQNESRQVKLEIWAKAPGMESTVQISKGKGVDIKIKNAVLESILIPTLQSFTGDTNTKQPSVEEQNTKAKEISIYKCDECDVCTRSKMYLKLHVEKVHVTGEIPCSHCSYKAKDNNIMKGHVMTKHFPLEVVQKCPKDNCDFKCISEEDLKLHITSSQNSNLCTFWVKPIAVKDN